MDGFLSREWAGLALAGFLGLVALAIVLAGRRSTARWLRWGLLTLGGLGVASAAFLAIGAGYHLRELSRDARRYPPPGRRYDVGGYRLHLVAAGENRRAENGVASPTVVWIPGGYTQGFNLYHLHSAIAKETRSVLFDRAGTGWSDVGPFPRTIPVEVAEVKRLLDASGEKGPFVLVGHSWGGLLANNFAAAYPASVAGLVLFEATPPENNTSPIGSKGLRMFAKLLDRQALFALFGGDEFIERIRGGKRVEGNAEPTDIIHQRLAPVWEMIQANEKRASAPRSQANSFLTLIGDPSVQVKNPGALGDIPLFSIMRRDLMGDPEKQKALFMQVYGISEQEWTPFIADVRRTGEIMQHQVEQLSRKGQRFDPPEGTSHQLPYENPDYALQRVRDMIERVSRQIPAYHE
jgi:pimeloyl-ACP methyl ester carboxylesterase